MKEVLNDEIVEDTLLLNEDTLDLSEVVALVNEMDVDS